MSYLHLALKCHKQAFYRAGAYDAFYTLLVAMHQLQCLPQFSSHHTSQYSIMQISSAAQCVCRKPHGALYPYMLLSRPFKEACQCRASFVALMQTLQSSLGYLTSRKGSAAERWLCRVSGDIIIPGQAA